MSRPFILSSVVAASLAGASLHAATDFFVYIGTNTNRKNSTVESKGIYLCGFDSKTGKLEPLGLVGELTNPSFLTLSPSKKFLYSVSESNSQGSVSSFSVDPTTGKLTPLNQQLSQGKGPCHVSMDPTGKTVMVANYGSGHVASFPVKSDGSLGEAASTHLQSPASKSNLKRQEGPHAHSIHADAKSQFVFACDLGCDRIFIYQLDATTGKLTPHSPDSLKLADGSGPRHFTFHPNGKFAYVNQELSMTVTSLAYDATTGSLTPLETISTLPPGTPPEERFSTAEVLVTPNGKFAYVSNRVHDTIACYTIDEATGKLRYVECAPALVEVPRNFGIDPTGKWMIVAGQKSNNLVIFSIDSNTGKLTPTGQSVEVGTPVCVKFLARESE